MGPHQGIEHAVVSSTRDKYDGIEVKLVMMVVTLPIMYKKVTSVHFVQLLPDQQIWHHPLQKKGQVYE